MLKSLATETSSSTVSPAAAGARRELVRAEASFDAWPANPRGFSAADPDTLARAVRAHKAGDAFAQAALTIALMLAIGTVAVVLSSGRAAAAGFLAERVVDHAATFAALALAGGALLFATRMTLRRVRVRARHRHWK
ncbi:MULTISPECIES: hypothetical protein [unclassified Xanthobacter]|uniref:hypothetical protein n=1 Tax=unclassified Xanthobacter TaxID=2623496 RepID=UPI001F3982BD|nr:MULTISPECIES: hypothetical protein [unclassified Xanthobacter]